MSQQASQPPTEVLRGHLGVELAIWVTEVEYEGRPFTRVSGRAQKRYCDKQGRWQSALYLSPVEWLVAAALYQAAYERYRPTRDAEPQPETALPVEP